MASMRPPNSEIKNPEKCPPLGNRHNLNISIIIKNILFNYKCADIGTPGPVEKTLFNNAMPILSKTDEINPIINSLTLKSVCQVVQIPIKTIIKLVTI